MCQPSKNLIFVICDIAVFHFNVHHKYLNVKQQHTDEGWLSALVDLSGDDCLCNVMQN